MQTKSRRKSIFGIRVSNDTDDGVGLVVNTTSNRITDALRTASFKTLYEEIRFYFVSPLINDNYVFLANNFQDKAESIIRSNRGYVASLTKQQKANLNGNLTIYEFYVGEVAKFIKIYGAEDSSYYMMADVLTLSNKGFISFHDIKSLQDVLANVKSALDEAKSIIGSNSTNTDLNVSTSTTVVVQINKYYIEYTRLYGFPVGGVFDSVLLGQIMIDGVDYTNYMTTQETTTT